MDIDETLIEEKKQWLNQTANGGWQRVDGFSALTAVEIKSNGYVFNPSRGIPLVAFIKKSTGEVRMFTVDEFKRK